MIAVANNRKALTNIISAQIGSPIPSQIKRGVPTFLQKMG